MFICFFTPGGNTWNTAWNMYCIAHMLHNCTKYKLKGRLLIKTFLYSSAGGRKTHHGAPLRCIEFKPNGIWNTSWNVWEKERENEREMMMNHFGIWRCHRGLPNPARDETVAFQHLYKFTIHLNTAAVSHGVTAWLSSVSPMCVSLPCVPRVRLPSMCPPCLSHVRLSSMCPPCLSHVRLSSMCPSCTSPFHVSPMSLSCAPLFHVSPMSLSCAPLFHVSPMSLPCAFLSHVSLSGSFAAAYGTEDQSAHSPQLAD